MRLVEKARPHGSDGTVDFTMTTRRAFRTLWGRGRLSPLRHLVVAAVVGAVIANSYATRAATSSAVAEPVVVAIDPGHGGTNLGAPGRAPRVYEKDVTLALARRIRALLTSDNRPGTPPIVVALCRDADRMLPIRARARCAGEMGAQWFISLHANAVPTGVDPASQRGFEVFVLGPREIEDDAALAVLSEQNPSLGVFAAHEVRAAAEKSIVLARVLAERLTHELGFTYWRGVKQSGAALDVLRGTNTPSALVEVGFLSHPDEGPALTTTEGQEPIARAIADAIAALVRSPQGLQPGTQPNARPKE